MTDKYVLGKGTLYFKGFGLGEVTPLKAAYHATAKIVDDIYERFVNEALFDVRVMGIVGYNPQKLLPAPSFEREMMQTVLEWAYAQMKKPITDPSWGSPGYGMLYPYQERAIEMLSRWNEPDARPLDDLQRGMHRLIDDIEPVLIVTGKLTKVEMRAIALSLNEQTTSYSDVSDAICKRISDSLGVNYEMLKRDFAAKPFVEPRKRQPAYLDHDPTKKHKRRKKR